MGEIKIDKGIEIPNPWGAPHKYPFAEMEIGDSFLIPSANGKAINTANMCAHWVKKLGHKYKTRAVEGGRRVWRVE